MLRAILSVLVALTEVALLAPGAHAGEIVQAPMDFPGALVVPADAQPHPGIVILANDRLNEARELAAQGFAVMMLCSWNCGVSGTPAGPREIDLSQTYEAFRWFRASQYVRARPTAFYGAGLGAEQALTLAVYLAKHPGLCTPNAVIAHAPPAVIENSSPPAWTWGGDLRGLQPGSPILLDRYSGNILITHGVDDSVTSVEFSRQYEQTLRSSGAPVRTVVHDHDPSVPPVTTGPGSDRGPVRADFHYFQGEGSIFDPAMDAVRIETMTLFLREVLGS